MRKIFMIFITFCLFFGFGNIAKADSKTICLHNKGGFVVKLVVHADTQEYKTGDVTLGLTKCVQILEATPNIEADVTLVGGGGSCTYNWSTGNPLPDSFTITTKGTIFNFSCSP
ncbi:MAG: hypothetical protein NTX36_09125 [Proteobacteria bacterium]|nr:hypothetical protein [Pseudomonadota bacterium]